MKDKLKYKIKYNKFLTGIYLKKLEWYSFEWWYLWEHGFYDYKKLERKAKKEGTRMINVVSLEDFKDYWRFIG